jgi:hypothetical protein
MASGDKNMEELKDLYIVGGSEKWCNLYGKQYGVSSKELKMELLYGAAIPLLGTHPKGNENSTSKTSVLPCLLQHYL